ncbi:hypothetical protein KCP75_12255 [Salmonella enterica subsp. enterica]|nr:hypothetical protein KCP75_12255 [Salmonella enterica subsp. enterica]
MLAGLPETSLCASLLYEIENEQRRRAGVCVITAFTLWRVGVVADRYIPAAPFCHLIASAGPRVGLRTAPDNHRMNCPTRVSDNRCVMDVRQRCYASSIAAFPHGIALW